MTTLQFLGKIFLVIIIVIAGGAVTCGGNIFFAELWVESDWDKWFTIWFIELFGLFIFAIWFVFIREMLQKMKQTKEQIQKEPTQEEKDLNDFSNFKGL